MFSRLGYATKQAFSQMGRNKGMYFTSIMAITAMMLILGLFFTAFVNIDLFTSTIQKNYNVVQVYVVDGLSESDIEDIGKQLENMSGVDKTEYVTSEEALKTLKKRWGENGYLLDSMDENPLPSSYMVYVTDKDAASYVAEHAKKVSGVEDITYYQDTIEKLAKVSRFIEIGSIAAMIFLVVISVIIVANTIKLTVLNREKEITIMKYLGATDSFVRAPFILGGIFMGLISSAVASGLIYIIYRKIIDMIGSDIMRVLSISLISANYLVINILAIFVVIGVGIGTIGSIISIRKFLMK